MAGNDYWKYASRCFMAEKNSTPNLCRRDCRCPRARSACTVSNGISHFPLIVSNSSSRRQRRPRGPATPKMKTIKIDPDVIKQQFPRPLKRHCLSPSSACYASVCTQKYECVCVCMWGGGGGSENVCMCVRVCVRCENGWAATTKRA